MDQAVGEKKNVFKQHNNLQRNLNVNMFFFPFERQESVALGGILIAHNLEEGKHEYRVENVVKYQKKSGERTFARYNMRLMRNVNSTHLLLTIISMKHIVSPDEWRETGQEKKSSETPKRSNNY